MVSLFAFIVTAHGMNPYLIGSFSSGFACENVKSQLIAAALEQRSAPSTITPSRYALEPRHLKCIATPGLIAGGARPPEPASPPRTRAAKRPAR